jgi:hypothetical protein
VLADAAAREEAEREILARLRGGATTLEIYDLPAVGHESGR